MCLLKIGRKSLLTHDPQTGTPSIVFSEMEQVAMWLQSGSEKAAVSI